jgi:hypothetical protein
VFDKLASNSADSDIVTGRMESQVDKKPEHSDLKTVALLRETLDEAWDVIPPEQQAGMLKTTLAERILKSAADGERDPERLREAALNPKKV